MTLRSAHIVFATVGSLGDLYPLLAVGRELCRRGHRVTIATHAQHAQTITAAGLDFADASGLDVPEDVAAFFARAFHPRRGPRFVVRDLAAADVRASHRKLQRICADADVLVTTTLAFGAQIIGETQSLRWLSAILAPAGFLSATDPPATGVALLDRWIRRSARRGRLLRATAERVTHAWTRGVRAYRRDLGLPAVSPRGDPFHRGQHAPNGVLAMFSPLLGEAQPDWPESVVQTGVCRYTPAEIPPDPSLQQFLQSGPPPLVFTLGSAVVHAGTDFLRHSLHVAKRLQQRAIVQTGSAAVRAQLPVALGDSILALEYAPHASLFPHARAIIHHGGAGTSQEALASGRPMLVVPHGFDQPDNAARLARLGVARVLAARRYNAERAIPEVQAVLTDSAMRARAADCARRLQRENGARIAADRIEAALSKRTAPSRAPDLFLNG